MSRRSERVGHIIQKELGRLLTEEARDPRLGFVTVVNVNCPNDLRNVKIYISVMGSPEQKKKTLLGLNSAKGYLRSRVGNIIQLRYVPEFHFIIDDTLDRADEFDRLMAEAGLAKDHKDGDDESHKEDS